MQKWTPFWFETNSAFGKVDSPAAWKKMRAAWELGAHGMKGNQVYDLTCVAAPGPRVSPLPSFGSRIEHLGGKQTLRQFFEENGMDTGIAASSGKYWHKLRNAST